MHRFFTLIAALLILGSLAACGSKTYEITTHSGHKYIANGSPEYNVKAATYTFVDEQGQEVVIKKNEIDAIKEQ